MDQINEKLGLLESQLDRVLDALTPAPAPAPAPPKADQAPAPPRATGLLLPPDERGVFGYHSYPRDPRDQSKPQALPGVWPSKGRVRRGRWYVEPTLPEMRPMTGWFNFEKVNIGPQRPPVTQWASGKYWCGNPNSSWGATVTLTDAASMFDLADNPSHSGWDWVRKYAASIAERQAYNTDRPTPQINLLSEFNGGWADNPKPGGIRYSVVGHGARGREAHVKVFRRFVELFREEGASPLMVWTPVAWNPGKITGRVIDPTECYPGSDVVDALGIDWYSRYGGWWVADKSGNKVTAPPLEFSGDHWSTLVGSVGNLRAIDPSKPVVVAELGIDRKTEAERLSAIPLLFSALAEAKVSRLFYYAVVNHERDVNGRYYDYRFRGDTAKRLWAEGVNSWLKAL